MRGSSSSPFRSATTSPAHPILLARNKISPRGRSWRCAAYPKRNHLSAALEDDRGGAGKLGPCLGRLFAIERDERAGASVITLSTTSSGASHSRTKLQSSLGSSYSSHGRSSAFPQTCPSIDPD